MKNNPIIRPATRTSITIWKLFCSSEAFKIILQEMPSFKMVEAHHAKFHFDSFFNNYSLPLIKSVFIKSSVQQQPEQKVLNTYEINVFHDTQCNIIYLTGKDRIINDIYAKLNQQYRKRYSSELPIIPLGINIRKLVVEHEHLTSKLHVQLKNTEGLTSLTLYGTDITRSTIYQTMLTGATFLTAKLHSPFNYKNIIIELNEHGTFHSDIVIHQDVLIDIVKKIRNEYAQN